jgi:glucose uptake protein
MVLIQSLPLAILLCIVTMLGWGSWANTQKLAGKEKWPFELFYWDYAIGVFLFSLIFAATLGTLGSDGPNVFENHAQAAHGYILPALAQRRDLQHIEPPAGGGH